MTCQTSSASQFPPSEADSTRLSPEVTQLIKILAREIVRQWKADSASQPKSGHGATASSQASVERPD